jgi:hypothetical protein
MPMEQRDIERILRDVVTNRDLRVTLVQVQPVDGDWLVTVRDPADRFVSTRVPNGPAAEIRTALANWLDPLS